MSVLKFRPRLESMDERIVPDAAPIAAPVAETAVVADPAPAPNGAQSPGSMTNEAINARIVVLENELRILTAGAEFALNEAIRAATQVTTAEADMLAATTVAGFAEALGRWVTASQALAAANAQLAATQELILQVQLELDALISELIRRDQAYPPVRDPIGIAPAASVP